MLPKIWIFGFNPFELESCGKLEEIDLSTFCIDSTTAGGVACHIEITATHALIATGKRLFSRSAITDERHQHYLGHRIEQISASTRHCLALLDNGDLIRYDIDRNQISKLEFLSVEEDSAASSGSLGEAEKERITHLACGDRISVAVTSNRSVFNIPNRTHTFPKHVRIVKVVVGLEHCLLLTGNGDVYSWGCGLRGQLGNGEITPHQETPQLVEALAGVKITDIAAGGWHSAAVSSFGDLYSWGWNSKGQLGLDQTKGSVFSLPQIVELTDDEGQEISFEKVHCGQGYTLAVSTKGDFYYAGEDLHRKFDYVKVERNPEFDGFKKFLTEFEIEPGTVLKSGTNSILFLEIVKELPVEPPKLLEIEGGFSFSDEEDVE